MISRGQRRAWPRHFTNFLHRAAVFSAPDINLPRPAAKHKIRKGTLSGPAKPRATSVSIKNPFLTRRKVRGAVRGGGEKKKQNGFKEHSKTFNHRRAARPGLSPTGAKRQMGSITALAGHTHTLTLPHMTSIAVSIKGNATEGEANGRRNEKYRRMSSEQRKEKNKNKKENGTQ